jgi:tetratricopeptide (TPR) repeat protein
MLSLNDFRRMLPGLVFAAFGFTGLTAAPANASITSLGAGQARECFEAAVLERNPTWAVDVCTSAIERETLNARDLAATYVNRGILRMRTADRRGAMADFDRAIRLMPNLGDAFVNRGVLLIADKQDRAAIDAITQGISVGCERPAIAYYSRAIAFELIGDFKSAYRDYKQAAELDPEWTLPRDQLGRFSVRKYG